MTDTLPLAKIRALIASKTGRSQLPPRNDPYWGPKVDRGLFVGYRSLEHGGNWIARWRDGDGKQHYHAIGPVDDGDKDAYVKAQKDAADWHKRMLTGLRVSRVATVADVCRTYVKDRGKAKSEATAKDAEQRFERTVYEHAIGRLPVGRINTKAIEAWRDELVTASGERKALSRASANRTLTALKAALNLAVRHKEISLNGAIEWGNVKPFAKAESSRGLFLDLTQRRALREKIDQPLLDFVDAAMTTGARPGEIANAKRSQFDVRTGVMRFIGKTGARDVSLPPSALEVFKRAAKAKTPEAPLFSNPAGGHWTRWEWNEGIKDAAARAELPDGVCLYVLRHSFITEAIGGGLSVLEVAKLTGTSLAMIDKHYGHLVANAARDRLALIAMV